MAWLLDSALSEANCRPTRHWFRHSIRIGTFAGQEQNAYVWLCKKKITLALLGRLHSTVDSTAQGSWRFCRDVVDGRRRLDRGQLSPLLRRTCAVITSLLYRP